MRGLTAVGVWFSAGRTQMERTMTQFGLVSVRIDIVRKVIFYLLRLSFFLSPSLLPVIIPFDGTPVTEVVGIFLYVSIPVYVFGGATIIVAIIFAIVNFIFRKRK